jgi:hypothetical protein
MDGAGERKFKNLQSLSAKKARYAAGFFMRLKPV